MMGTGFTGQQEKETIQKQQKPLEVFSKDNKGNVAGADCTSKKVICLKLTISSQNLLGERMRKRTSNSSIDTATIKKQHRTEAVRLVRMTTRQGIEEPCDGKLSSTVC